MFFKKIKNKLLFMLLLLIIPSITLAYSDYVIAGGENIGIELSSNGVIIVGTYEINGNSPAEKAGLQNGDKIVKINEQEIFTIEDMLKNIEKVPDKTNIRVTYIRGNKENKTTLTLNKDSNNVYKTGLYVKDKITGIGTLTFIDPNTSLFVVFVHEIIEKNTGQKLDIKDGKIYSSTVTGITKSSIGRPGEKNAKYDSSITFGNVFENTTNGIFGNYSADIPEDNLYKVISPEKAKTGSAKILTVIDGNNIKEFEINILKINPSNTVSKNFLFEIIDKELLEKTGGIVQGMSGSPIIQNDTIIGAVTHVVVDDPTKGYGISIIKMLEEAEN